MRVRRSLILIHQSAPDGIHLEIVPTFGLCGQPTVPIFTSRFFNCHLRCIILPCYAVGSQPLDHRRVACRWEQLLYTPTPPTTHTHDTRNIGTRTERNITHWKTICYKENERKNIAEKSTEPADKNEGGGGYKGGMHPTGRVYILMWNSRSYAEKTGISHARARHTFLGRVIEDRGYKGICKERKGKLRSEKFWKGLQKKPIL